MNGCRSSARRPGIPLGSDQAQQHGDDADHEDDELGERSVNPEGKHGRSIVMGEFLSGHKKTVQPDEAGWTVAAANQEITS